MVIIISGASHVGKTKLAQTLLEKYHYPYLSIDHLKMGLIRAKYTNLTPLSDDKDLTEYLWPVIREMIKTAIENEQNLIVEGCYVPFDWKKDFSDEYRSKIRHLLLIMSENYINNYFENIKAYGCVIEKRLYDEVSKADLINDNQKTLRLAKENSLPYVLIDENYDEILEGSRIEELLS